MTEEHRRGRLLENLQINSFVEIIGGDSLIYLKSLHFVVPLLMSR